MSPAPGRRRAQLEAMLRDGRACSGARRLLAIRRPIERPVFPDDQRNPSHNEMTSGRRGQ
jgi:hypothetical protein